MPFQEEAYYLMYKMRRKIFYNQVEEVEMKRKSSNGFKKFNDNIYKIELGSDLIFTFILILTPNGT
jgi:hypothetical protein